MLLHQLDEFLRLVLFHVIEVLPKEKKAREEKTAPIGQGVLDLSSLLKGKIWERYTRLISGIEKHNIKDSFTLILHTLLVYFRIHEWSFLSKVFFSQNSAENLL